MEPEATGALLDFPLPLGMAESKKKKKIAKLRPQERMNGGQEECGEEGH